MENRSIRFATINGLDREDLPLAAEIWREDLRSQVWATREMLRLATLFVRYMADARPEKVALSYIERTCQLDGDQVRDALRQMQTYGAVEAFTLDADNLSVALNLTLLQRLRVLRCRHELLELIGGGSSKSRAFPVKDTPEWLPAPIDSPLNDEPGDNEVCATTTAA